MSQATVRYLARLSFLQEAKMSRYESRESIDFSLTYDVVIIGAGINGAVSAAALSSRGLKVLLVDQGDIASMTSQQSSNLVWGGIKYLQSYEFGWCSNFAWREPGS
jgi:glycerol-3-phosphate dehydrogenase